MNFSMYTKFYNTVRERGIVGAAEYAKSLGFSSVEFFEFVNKDWQAVVPSIDIAKEYRRVLDDRGLTVACYSVAAGLYDPNAPDGIDRNVEQTLMRYAERAATLGSPFLHHTITLGCPTDLPYEEMLKTVLPAVVRVAKYAQTLGVTCIYEDQGPYFNGVDGFRGFFEAVKAEEPSVGVCGDFGNTYFVDESSVDFIRAFAKEIRHVHVKDYTVTDPDGSDWKQRSVSGKHIRDVLPGQGLTDHARLFSYLGDYQGDFSMEFSGSDEEMRTSLAYVKELIPPRG
jgi:sugar phosphate isomerase/epimerase